MKRFLLHLLILAVIGAIGAGLIIGLGLYNVSARQGHLPGVSWVLHTTYRNAVELRAPPAAEVPDLASSDLIALGARHYDSACRFCHGPPGGRQGATPRAMEPPPPPILEAIRHWQPRHLFWIVLNGVKMTGMPGWPTAAREDEVWAVVAFLETLQREGRAESYADLVAPPGEAEEAPRLQRCAVCHGLDGEGRGNARVPRLDMQKEAYLAASLEAFRDGSRESGIMRQAAASLDDKEISILAAHFAAGGGPLGPADPPDAGDSSRAVLIQKGRALAFGLAADPDVPACRACHGPWPTRRSPLFPNLAGQHELYLATQMRLWREGLRGGTERSNLMHRAAVELTDDAIKALAAFYAAGAPTLRNTAEDPASSPD